jgi:LmbE family N-acetylglucosaminyl deacetylase
VNHVCLSPHLDDAVLSCGGAIHRHTAAGEAVQVITVFAGDFSEDDISPFAALQHSYWGDPPWPMPLRRAEDAAALTSLAAQVLHLDYLDAVYRAAPEGAWLYTEERALWQGVHSADPMVRGGMEDLVDRLAGLIPSRDQALVYAPLGVGRHVDHEITHRAARQLLEMGYQVAFYEDYPYAERSGALESALVAAGADGWRSEAIALDAADLTAKVSALSYYRSQLAVLFGGAEAMPGHVWSFATTRSPQPCLAERIWWPAEA